MHNLLNYILLIYRLELIPRCILTFHIFLKFLLLISAEQTDHLNQIGFQHKIPPRLAGLRLLFHQITQPKQRFFITVRQCCQQLIIFKKRKMPSGTSGKFHIWKSQIKFPGRSSGCRKALVICSGIQQNHGSFFHIIQLLIYTKCCFSFQYKHKFNKIMTMIIHLRFRAK